MAKRAKSSDDKKVSPFTLILGALLLGVVIVFVRGLFSSEEPSPAEVQGSRLTTQDEIVDDVLLEQIQ